MRMRTSNSRAHAAAQGRATRAAVAPMQHDAAGTVQHLRACRGMGVQYSACAALLVCVSGGAATAAAGGGGASAGSGGGMSGHGSLPAAQQAAHGRR